MTQGYQPTLHRNVTVSSRNLSSVTFRLSEPDSSPSPITGVMSEKSKTEAKNIVFFHPDLGIGGAERLIIDAAVGLQKRGHKVTIFTCHCDPQHCFDEARDGKLFLPLS